MKDFVKVGDWAVVEVKKTGSRLYGIVLKVYNEGNFFMKVVHEDYRHPNAVVTKKNWKRLGVSDLTGYYVDFRQGKCTLIRVVPCRSTSYAVMDTPAQETVVQRNETGIKYSERTTTIPGFLTTVYENDLENYLSYTVVMRRSATTGSKTYYGIQITDLTNMYLDETDEKNYRQTRTRKAFAQAEINRLYDFE